MTTQTLPLPIGQTVAPAVQGWPPLLDARLADTSLAPNERLALTEFLAALHAQYGDWLDAVILYSSAARGEVRFAPDATDTFDSDVDLLIVLNREATREEQATLRELVYEPERRHTCDLTPLVMTPKAFAWHARGSSLWLNIQVDGIWLWSQDDVVPLPNRRVIQEQFSASGTYELTESQCDEIRLHFKRAEEELEAAQLMVEMGMARAAIDSCYTAAFHAASALLLTRGITRAKHADVCNQLAHHFSKSQILPPTWDQLYEKLRQERTDSIYNLAYEPSQEVAEQRLAWAHEFVDAARSYLTRAGYLNE